MWGMAVTIVAMVLVDYVAIGGATHPGPQHAYPLALAAAVPLGGLGTLLTR